MYLKGTVHSYEYLKRLQGKIRHDYDLRQDVKCNKLLQSHI